MFCILIYCDKFWIFPCWCFMSADFHKMLVGVINSIIFTGMSGFLFLLQSRMVVNMNSCGFCFHGLMWVLSDEFVCRFNTILLHAVCSLYFIFPSHCILSHLQFCRNFCGRKSWEFWCCFGRVFSWKILFSWFFSARACDHGVEKVENWWLVSDLVNFASRRERDVFNFIYAFSFLYGK